MLNQKHLIPIAGCLTVLGLQSCALVTFGDRQTDRLIVTGSSTVAPLAAEIAKQFEADNPDTRVDVQTGGSTRGLSDARQGIADIGMVSRALMPEEEQELLGFEIALDGIALIVHRDNPVLDLSDSQVLSIFQGDIQNWSELGGSDSSIVVVNKAEGRSTLELFLGYFDLQNSEIDADVVIGDNQQGIKTVAGNVNAIGYVSIGAAQFDIDRGTPIRLLSLGGTEATTNLVQSGEFPLSRPLTFVTAEPPSGLTRDFIEYAQSENVHDLIRQQNFIPSNSPELEGPNL